VKVLFVHHNCPGQYKHLAPWLAGDPANEVVFVSHPKRPGLPGVRKVEYRPRRTPAKSTHPYARTLEEGVLRGQEVARRAIEMRKAGFYPDVICAHMGWGEGLYLKDVWPRAALLGYFEFYYRASGSDADFGRSKPLSIDHICRLRTRNALHLLSLEAADWGVSPTRWQWQQHPAEYRHKITILHDGIDTEVVRPDPAAVLTLPSGTTLRAGDPVVTYVARNLEPYRGFPSFLRAVERIQRQRPDCHVLVVGGDGVSYGAAPADGRTWRQVLLEKVSVDPARTHFLGHVSYDQFVRVLQVSAAHIYLTVPFVLSWSMLEAMAAGCAVVGSRTAPVEEVLEDGRNGLLADFHSPDEIADRVAAVLDAPDRMAPLRRAARRTVLERYDLRNCLRRQKELMVTLASGTRPAPTPATRPAEIRRVSSPRPSRLAGGRRR
jgi:glycosyltransferase involved in cell wall biosynthesis